MSQKHTRLALLRTRWSAIGAAVAITLGAGGLGVAQATIDSGDRPVTVTIAAERILDTRTNLGLSGRFADGTPRDLQVTGTVPVASGPDKIVVPADAIGVVVNVTVVTPTHDGFLSLRPQGATGDPTTSTVNFTPGSIEPNGATVNMNNGQIQIWVETSSDSGAADVLIDVVGYTIGHTHDDRYYTEDEADEMFVPHGEIVMRNDTAEVTANACCVPTTISSFGGGSRVTGDGGVNISLTGPAVLGGVDYGLKSIEYCVASISSGAFVERVQVYSSFPATGTAVASDSTARSANGCYSLDVNDGDNQSYSVFIDVAGGGTLRIAGIQSTWAPTADLSTAATVLEGASAGGA